MCPGSRYCSNNSKNAEPAAQHAPVMPPLRLPNKDCINIQSSTHCHFAVSYSVTLEDFPEITSQYRVEAERRFRKALERALGGETEVPGAYRAWQNAEESAESELSEDDRQLAQRWQKAAMRARQDGFQGLGDSDEAYFEIRLQR